MSGSVSRISLDEALSLPDVLSGDNFRFQLGEIPGSGDTASLEIKCQQATLPGRQNQSMEIPIGGFVRTFRGRNRFGQNTMAVSFVEVVDLSTYKALYNWLEQIDGTQSGTSQGYVKDYSVSAELTMFDQTGNSINTWRLYNLYIVSLTDVNLEVAQSTPIIVNADFRYDYYESDIVQMR